MIEFGFTSRWPSERLGVLFTENTNRNSDFTVQTAYQFYFGSIIPKKYFDLTEELINTYKKYTVVQPGDIMINGLNLNYDFVTQRVGLVKNNGIITSAYLSIRPKVNISETYYAYLLKTVDAMKIFHGLGTGIRKTLAFSDLKNFELPVPPREEQDQIVRYLDWQVSKINKLIAAKRKEIKQLDELKKAAVNEVVTRGTELDVPMKYSGVEWLGDIPAHWTTIKLRQILRPFSEKNHPDLPLLSVVREQGVIVRDVEDKGSNHNFIPDDLSGYKLVKKGQFAMNKMKAWQGSYGISDYTGIVSPAYFIFDVIFENLEYFHYAIRSKVYVNFFAQASDGIRVGQWDLDINKMKEIPFIVPPADEQQNIVDYLPIVIDRYDTSISKIEDEISALIELKNRMISDAVTGQIDVRGIEIPEFEFVEDVLDNFEDSYNEGFEEQERE